jgi:hypothetical protein
MTGRTGDFEKLGQIARSNIPHRGRFNGCGGNLSNLGRNAIIASIAKANEDEAVEEPYFRAQAYASTNIWETSDPELPLNVRKSCPVQCTNVCHNCGNNTHWTCCGDTDPSSIYCLIGLTEDEIKSNVSVFDFSRDGQPVRVNDLSNIFYPKAYRIFSEIERRPELPLQSRRCSFVVTSKVFYLYFHCTIVSCPRTILLEVASYRFGILFGKDFSY